MWWTETEMGIETWKVRDPDAELTTLEDLTNEPTKAQTHKDSSQTKTVAQKEETFEDHQLKWEQEREMQMPEGHIERERDIKKERKKERQMDL